MGNPNDGPKTAEQFFNTSAFVRPPIYEFGNASPNITNADRILSLDFTLHKAFKITERHATPSATSMPAILAASTASGSLRGRFSSVCAIASKPTRFVQRKGRGSPRPFLVMRPSTGCHRLPRRGLLAHSATRHRLQDGARRGLHGFARAAPALAAQPERDSLWL